MKKPLIIFAVLAALILLAVAARLSRKPTDFPEPPRFFFSLIIDTTLLCIIHSKLHQDLGI